MVDHGYLPTMRIPLIAGRHLTERDTATSERVVVLNEKAARVLFRGEDAIGKMVRILNNDVRVTGVVGNVRHQSLEQEGSSRSISRSPRFPRTPPSSSSVQKRPSTP
jgi:hypothetical protein